MRLLKLAALLVFAGYTSSLFAYPGDIVKTIKLQHKFPTGLTWDGEKLWYADYKADKLVAVDPESGETVKEIPSPGFWPLGLAFDGRFLWNIDKKQNRIFQINPDDGTIIHSISAPTANCEGITWDGSRLWVTDSRNNLLMELDLADGTAVTTLRAPATNTQGITFDGTYFWISDRREDEIYMVHPSNGEVIMFVEAPGPYSRGMAFDGNNLWNIDYQNDELYKLVRKDDDKFKLTNKRKARVTFTHQVKPFGNGNIQDLEVFIAIPEDLNQQKINSLSFSPEYEKVTDGWDQSYARFHYTGVPSGEVLHSEMTVETEISDIHYYIYPENCGTLNDIPDEIKETYLADDTKYLVNNPYMQNLARSIVGNEQNPYYAARKIFDHVRGTLEYALEGGWNTAPYVLLRGTGSCSEYTFAFISLCRAAGIPARYVGSIVVRGDDASLDEVFHRWPEIYLPNYGWIPIDPQGGDKPMPKDRIRNIGYLSNRFLITTITGGDTPYMGWYYNSYEAYITDPQVIVNVETFGEWEPLD